MSEKEYLSEVTFKIELQDSSSDIYDDVQYVTFIRIPIIKQGSFCIIYLNLPVVVVKNLQISLANNVQDIWKMRIFMINPADHQKIRCIYDKHIQILAAQEQEIIVYTKNYVFTKLIVSNPIIYSLQTTTSFNTILSNVTGYDALLAYENFLKGIYGSIDFHHVGVNSEKNDFIYEQIFIPPTINTLNACKYIINTYKPFHSYSFYFFDDFYITENSNSEITAHLVNLAGIDQEFEKVDIQEYMDYIKLSRKIAVREFTDPFLVLDKAIDHIVAKTREIAVKAEKTFNTLVTELTQQDIGQEKILGNELKISKNQIQMTSTDKTNRVVIIQVPDIEENAKKRLQIAKKLMFNKLERLVIYETDYCLPFWLKFGFIYNMNLEESEEYEYTPISIINNFRRTESKETEHTMIHSCKYVMLKIIPPSMEDLLIVKKK